jgi:hypothetical protein
MLKFSFSFNKFICSFKHVLLVHIMRKNHVININFDGNKINDKRAWNHWFGLQ